MQQTTSGVTRSLEGDGQEIIKTIRRFSEDTLELIKSPIVDVFHNRAMGGSSCETLRFLSSIETTSDFERTAKSLLILSAYKAEKQSPLSSYLLLKLLAKENKNERLKRLLKKDDIDGILNHVNEETIESLAKNAIYLAGANGNITVTTGGVTHISVDDSISFPVLVSPSFENANNQTFRQICIYDGVIETVGEINSFLEEASSKRSNVLLMARAFANDVVSTILSNNRRGVFDIIPVTPGMGIFDEFTMIDLSLVTNTTIEKPNLKNSNSFKMLIEGGKLKITINEKNDINNFVSRLRDERKSFNNEEISKVINDRISRVSSRRVTVCIGEEFGDGQNIAKDKFDSAMRIYLSSRKNGIIEFNNELFPGNSLNTALNVFNSLIRTLHVTGGTLVINKNLALAKR